VGLQVGCLYVMIHICPCWGGCKKHWDYTSNHAPTPERLCMTLKIINLSTGLEFLPQVKPDGYSRLQSSHLEAKAWQKFLDSVDANILYNLAQGAHVVIYDCGSRRDDGCSRVIWQGVPLIKYVCERAWGLQGTPAMVKHYNAAQLFDDIYKRLDKQKVRYFCKHLQTASVNLTGAYKKSALDGRK
jgi:hypothetical protein